MPKDRNPSKPTRRRYSPEEKAAAAGGWSGPCGPCWVPLTARRSGWQRNLAMAPNPSGVRVHPDVSVRGQVHV